MQGRAVKELEAGSAFFAELDADVSHYAAVWHTYKVGQMMANDLNRVARRLGLSMPDFHVLGALRIEGDKPVRATDLAQTLYVTNAVLSARIARLERKGLLTRSPCAIDRRAFELKLTPEGVTMVSTARDYFAKSGKFVSCYRRLNSEDQQSLARIMGELHNQFARDFLTTSR